MALLTTTFFFGIITLLTYFLLSMLHIYDSTYITLDCTPTHHYNAGPSNASSEEYLFRIGNLHVYGIRGLFIGVVVGGSMLCATAVGYVACTHRRTVGWDRSKLWREPKPESSVEGENAGIRLQRTKWLDPRPTHKETPPESRIIPGSTSFGSSRPRDHGSITRSIHRPSFVSASTSCSALQASTRYSGGSVCRFSRCHRRVTKPLRRTGQDHARRAVSFLRRRTRERNIRIHGNLAVADAAQCRRPLSEVSRLSSFGGVDCGHEIPSYSFDEATSQSSTGYEPMTTISAAWGRRNSGIPSYYFKKHDADGRSIFDLKERSSFDVRDMNGSGERPDVAKSSCGPGRTNKNDDDDIQSFGNMASRGSIGRSRTKLTSSAAEIAPVPAARANLNGDNGWDSVSCSGWKGKDDRLI